MTAPISNDPLHGVTLEMQVNAEVEALYLDSLHDDGNEEQDEPAFNPWTDGRTPRS